MNLKVLILLGVILATNNFCKAGVTSRQLEKVESGVDIVEDPLTSAEVETENEVDDFNRSETPNIPAEVTSEDENYANIDDDEDYELKEFNLQINNMNKTTFEKLKKKYIMYKHSSFEQKARIGSTNKAKTIEFQLFTRDNHLRLERLVADDPNSLTNSSFDASHRTIVIIHGYLENAEISPWMKTMRDLFLSFEPTNVIMVQWYKLAYVINYWEAAKNANLVGSELAKLLDALQAVHGLRSEDVHLIGFSLGAQAAGFAGKKFRGLGRITGLDPAGPDFEGKSEGERLSRNDANFVDVVHSNAGSLVDLHFGYKDPIGHVDFYLNDGSNQPGCPHFLSEAAENILDGRMRDVHPCDHERSYLVFIESLKSRQPIRGYQCESHYLFQSGACMSNPSNVLGMHPDSKIVGSFYVTTQAKSPYATKYASVVLDLSKESLQLNGDVKLTSYPLDRLTQEITLQAKASRGHWGGSYRGIISLPYADPLSSVPLQLRYDYLYGYGTLRIRKLEIKDESLNSRSLEACDFEIEHGKWVSIDPSLSPCTPA